MASRQFPLNPRSSRLLEAGDIVAVPVDASSWGCLVVVEVRRSGVGARTTFIAGTVRWHGDRRPTEDDIDGLSIIEQALVPIDLFAEGDVQVVGNIGPVWTPLASNYRDHHVGVVHRVWGWRSALEHARDQAQRSRAGE